MNSGRSFVLAEVIDVKESPITYPSCPQCCSKVYTHQQTPLSYFCTKCDVKLLDKEVKYRFRLTLVICDNTTQSVVTVFGTCLEQFFGCTAAFLNKYLLQIEKEVSVPSEVEIETLLQDAIRNAFIGRMLLFGFKVLSKLAFQNQKSTQEEKVGWNSTLEYVTKQSKMNNCDTDRNILQSTCSQVVSTQNAKWSTLVAFQTVDPNPNQKFIPVINTFKHELACLISGHAFTEKKGTLSETTEWTPVHSSNRRRQSAAWSVKSSGIASFCQPALMLSCDIETSDDDTSAVFSHSTNSWAIDNNVTKDNGPNSDVTFSPVEVARARNSVDSSRSFEANLEGVDFDETIDPDAVSSMTQTESLIATQSQHLSQTDTETSKHDCTEMKEDITEHITSSNVPHTCISLLRVHQEQYCGNDYDCHDIEDEPEKCTKKSVRDEVDSGETCDNELNNSAGTNNGIPSFKSKSKDTELSGAALCINGEDNETIDEGSLNDSELLLACNNDDTERNGEVECGNGSVKSLNDGKSAVKDHSHLKIGDICDSFDEGDSELLLAADMLNAFNVNEQVETVPESEVQPDVESHLPFSEGLDSFLGSQLSERTNFGHDQRHTSITEERHTTSITEERSEIKPLHNIPTLPESEDLFSEPDVMNRSNTVSKECDITTSASTHGNGRTKCIINVTMLPDSEDLEHFIDGSQLECQNDNQNMDSLDGAAGRSRNLPDSEGLTSFLGSIRGKSSKNHLTVDDTVIPVIAKEVSISGQLKTEGLNKGTEDAERIGANTVASNVQSEGNLTDGNISCNDNTREVQSNGNSGLEHYSNDLFSASECEMSISLQPDNIDVNDSELIPGSQTIDDSSVNNVMPKLQVIPKSERRKSVHFAQNILECKNISGIDMQMRTTPVVNFLTTGRKSCLRNLNCAPDLPFSPVTYDDDKELLGGLSQGTMYTPSPEIVTTVLRQIENTSYQSTPLSHLRNTDAGSKLKHIEPFDNRSHSKVMTSREYVTKCNESVKEHEAPDYSSQELFSENSCDLFVTSHCVQSHQSNNKSGSNDSLSFSSQNIIPKSTGVSKRHVSRFLRQTQAKAFEISSDMHNDIEMLSTNSEELFSNGSLADYMEEVEDICKKLF